MGEALCGPYPARFNIDWEDVNCKNCLTHRVTRKKSANYEIE